MAAVISENVPLASRTTLALGGSARWFAECRTERDVQEALAFARQRDVPVWILGGGSNTIVRDEGYPGLVLHLAMSRVVAKPTPGGVALTAQAGAPWDDVVRRSVADGWTGIECLSGIPGSAGAAPIQNIGAYGQEIAETLTRVTCLDRHTLRPHDLAASECGLGYRTSRFKAADAGRWIVLEIELWLAAGRSPALRYDELRTAVGGEAALAALPPAAAVARVRDAVLGLRRRKGMVLDPADPDTRSVGSFFTNPVMDAAAFERLCERWRASGGAGDPPAWRTGGSVKVAAAWLVEQAGFAKGTRQGGAAVSAKHSLALVNYGGTTTELLALARDIEAGVWERFGVRLEREPVLMA